MAIWLALIAIVFLTRGRWDAWVVERQIHGFPDCPDDSVITPDRKRLIGGWGEDKDTVYRVYDTDTWRRVCSIRTGTPVPLLTDRDAGRPLSPAGDLLVTLTREEAEVQDGGADRRVSVSDPLPVVVDTRTGARVCSLKGHTGWINYMEFSSDGLRVVTGGADRTVRVWDVTTGRCLLVLRGHEDEVIQASYSPDGSRILTTSRDRTTRSWNAASGERVAILGGRFSAAEYGPECHARYCLDGGRVLLLRPWTTSLWDARTHEKVADLGNVDFLDIAPDGRRIAVSRWNGACRILDAGTGELLTEIKQEEGDGSIAGITFSPDGSLVAVYVNATYRMGLQLYDADTAARLLSFTAYRPGPVFMPDWRVIMTREDRMTLRDGRTSEKLCELPYMIEYIIIDRDRILVWEVRAVPDGGRDVFILRRIRPEWWWGVFWLWHFWVIVTLGLALTWSVWRDRRELRSRRP
jgi:WD40 repeat protein